MENLLKHFESLLAKGVTYISNESEADLKYKKSPEKWSKKEILGHLIDSAINNLQRFTEIQFESQPYQIQSYNQNELVQVNNYQEADTNEILQFWLYINKRILGVVKELPTDKLNLEIVFKDGAKSDFNFLIKDYVAHLEHHLNQIID